MSEKMRMKNKSVNLFLVGGMKCGSTTLHDYLAEHPEIFMSLDKEPGFFVPEIWEDRQDSEYFDLFASADMEQFIGESSTFYSKIPTFKGVPERIHSYNDKAKILYIVRNPFERIVSHYFHHRRNLMLHAEKRPIMKAVQQDERYIAYTDYPKQIKPYIDLFGEQNVKVVKFESLLEDHNNTLAEIFAWLGVDSTFVPEGNKKSNAKPKQAEVVRGAGIMNKIRYSKFWGKISPWFPAVIKRTGNALAAQQNELELTSHEVEQLKRYLSPVSVDIASRLENMVNIDCAEWKR